MALARPSRCRTIWCSLGGGNRFSKHRTALCSGEASRRLCMIRASLLEKKVNVVLKKFVYSES
jgi:hypothetical protein